MNKDNALPSNARERRMIHNKKAAEVKAAKKVRGVRAEIHEAMLVAAAMKRSKKKGTANLDDNMAAQGFNRMSPDGRGYPVEVKYVKVEVEA